MRVVIFGNFINHEIALANSLSNTDQVLVLTPGRKVYGRVAKLVRGDFEVIFAGRHRLVFHPANIIEYLRVRKKVRAFEPDVVHMEIFGAFTDLAFFPMFKKYPVVMTFHDVEPHKGEESLMNTMVRRLLRRRADRLIVHGQSLKEMMTKRLSVPADKVDVVPLGAGEFDAFKIFERDDVKEENNFVLFFGRLYEYKGLEYLIKAEPLITSEVPDVKIVIAGAGEDFCKYRKMMAGREERFVVLNRRLTFEEGAELFQRCSLVVLPYVEASQSGVVTVAYGFKKPVVVTDVGSIPELVHDGETGIIVPPRNSEELAKAVVKLLRDPRLRREMGENGHRMLTTSHSKDAVALSTRAVYQTAIKSKEMSHSKGHKSRDRLRR